MVVAWMRRRTSLKICEFQEMEIVGEYSDEVIPVRI